MRCAMCHGDLEPAAAEACEGCGTLLHLECGESLERCPTLGCDVVPSSARERLDPVRAFAGSEADGPGPTWWALGVVAPAITLGLDAVLRVNPLVWVPWAPRPEPLPARIQVAWLSVAALAGLSMLGLRAAARGNHAAALPFLALGVAFMGAHAAACVPLLPWAAARLVRLESDLVSGLLAVVPFLALRVYVGALRWTCAEARAAKVPDPLARAPWGHVGAGAAALLLVVTGATTYRDAPPPFRSVPPAVTTPAPAPPSRRARWDPGRETRNRALVLERLDGVDRAALLAAARTVEANGFDAGLPEPLPSLAAGATVSVGGGSLLIEWPDGASLMIVLDGRPVAPFQHEWGREMHLEELEPGLWLAPRSSW